jgi:hypothetical protein
MSPAPLDATYDLPPIAVLINRLPNSTLGASGGRLSRWTLTSATLLSVGAFLLAASMAIFRSHSSDLRLIVNLGLLGGMALLLVAFVAMIFDVGWRLRKGLTAWLAPLDANWTEEQNLIKELRAFPVEVLGPLARRVKTEIQLNDRAGARVGLVGGLLAGSTAILLVFSPQPDPKIETASAVTQATAAAKSPAPFADLLRAGLGALVTGASLAALAQNSVGGRLLRLELLLNEACLGDRREAGPLTGQQL